MTDGNTFLQAAGLGNMARIEQVGSTNLPLSIGGTPNGQPRQQQQQLRNTIDKLLGETIQLNETRSVDLDKTYQSAPHSAIGLGVAVSGRATIVNADVAEHLASFQDPIKSLLGVALHRDTRVIIKRRFVQGGDAQPLPERAPGRSVSIKTEEREVVLARYGADIEMSVNLMMGEPALAQEDLQMKLTFQKRQLDRKLVDLGYEAIMSTATDAARAMLESMPARSGMTQSQAALELESIRANVFFGAFAKYEQPLQNLLAASKRGALPNADVFDTIIVPAGLPDIYSFTRQEARHFMLNGTSQSELEGVKFDLQGGLYDAPTGLSVFVTHAKPNYVQGGTLRPRMQKNALYRERTIAMWYPKNDWDQMQIMDYLTGEWTDMPATAATGGVRLLTLMMSSAIIGKSGSDTGELIVAYPMTQVHTVETSPEYMKMQLRTHLGAAVYRPENIQVLPDVHFEGVVSQEDVIAVPVDSTGTYKFLNHNGNGVAGNISANGAEVLDIRAAPSTKDLPGIAYRGAYRFKSNGDSSWTYVKNNGHLANLDCPEGSSKIRGMNTFQRTPIPVDMRMC